MSVARTILLAAASNNWLRDHATKRHFVRRSVSAFMPGERLDDAIAAALVEERRHVETIITRLGENLTSAKDADNVARHYLDAFDRLAAAGLRTQISVKPTQLGLDFDQELCFTHLRHLIDRAAALDNFVWIDMERSSYVDRTLDLFRRARSHSSRVGVALQASLRRTETDVESLLPLGASIRLVKGAYLEPASIAFPRKADVDANFHALACRMLAQETSQPAALLQIATHDRRLIDRLAAFIDTHHGPMSRYEFAMLYGIQRSLQQQLATAGRPLRVLISYGDDWFPWYMRRLAERPSNVWFVVRNVFAR